jgi:hypothetical protein
MRNLISDCEVLAHILKLLTSANYQCHSTDQKIQIPHTYAKGQEKFGESSTQDSSNEEEQAVDAMWQVTVGEKQSGDSKHAERLAGNKNKRPHRPFFRIDLKSPIFNVNIDFQHFTEQLDDICKLLKQNYNFLQDNRAERQEREEGEILRLCVHVGWKDNQESSMVKFDSRSTVRLMGILWVLEERLNNLHPSFTQWNTKAQPLTLHCNLKYDLSTLEALNKIFKCKTAMAVLKLTQNVEREVRDVSNSDVATISPHYQTNILHTYMTPKNRTCKPLAIKIL